MTFIADKYWKAPIPPERRVLFEGCGVSDGAGPSMEVENGKRIVRDRTIWFFKDLPHLHHARQLAYILNATALEVQA
tara:strand:+ start:482 stop:712 length:231 start_codon:yes stop_codon:yes gene_type:complete